VSSAVILTTRKLPSAAIVAWALEKPGLLISGSKEAFTAFRCLCDGNFRRIVAVAFICNLSQVLVSCFGFIKYFNFFTKQKIES